jgi:hypothetical protein
MLVSRLNMRTVRLASYVLALKPVLVIRPDVTSKVLADLNSTLILVYVILSYLSAGVCTGKVITYHSNLSSREHFRTIRPVCSFCQAFLFRQRLLVGRSLDVRAGVGQSPPRLRGILLSCLLLVPGPARASETHCDDVAVWQDWEERTANNLPI